jgi:ABC-type glutathione transport system ATPase component
MLAIGRALIAQPQLMLLDEPSLGLAPKLVEDIFTIIARINAERGTSMLLVEQNATVALAVAHSGYIMENGKIVIDGRPNAWPTTPTCASSTSAWAGRRSQKLQRHQALQAPQALAVMKHPLWRFAPSPLSRLRAGRGRHQRGGAALARWLLAGPRQCTGSAMRIDTEEPELTLPQMLRRARARCPRVAIRQKDFGIWKPFTWAQYYQRACHFGLGLAQLGLPAGGHVGVIPRTASNGCWRRWARA